MRPRVRVRWLHDETIETATGELWYARIDGVGHDDLIVSSDRRFAIRQDHRRLRWLRGDVVGRRTATETADSNRVKPTPVQTLKQPVLCAAVGGSGWFIVVGDKLPSKRGDVIPVAPSPIEHRQGVGVLVRRSTVRDVQCCGG